VMKQKATLRVPGLKVAVPLPADTLPRDLVPMEGPAGEPVIELVLAGSTLTAIAQLRGGDDLGRVPFGPKAADQGEAGGAGLIDDLGDALADRP
jgi:hypothetical protein